MFSYTGWWIVLILQLQIYAMLSNKIMDNRLSKHVDVNQLNRVDFLADRVWNILRANFVEFFKWVLASFGPFQATRFFGTVNAQAHDSCMLNPS